MSRRSQPKSAAKSVAYKIPVIGRILLRDRQLQSSNRQLSEQLGGFTRLFRPVGHFYSPIPSPDEIAEALDRSASGGRPVAPGIDLRSEQQLELLGRLGAFSDDLPVGWRAPGPNRYCYDNSAFGHADAIHLYSILRLLCPARLLEVGSGYSSCVSLDTNELFLENRMSCTFIDPHPELLLSLIHEGDLDRIEVIPERLQDVDIEHFTRLESGDVLFIDSTHVLKLGSDVDRWFSQILPVLAPGVWIHIHDVFYPFEYPDDWIRENRALNELYALEAFLQFNDRFEIVLFGSYLEQEHRDRVEELMPLSLQDRSQSIWLRKC